MAGLLPRPNSLMRRELRLGQPVRIWRNSPRRDWSRRCGTGGQDIAIRDDKIHRDARGMKRVGLIGCGAIGRPVARALLAGTAGAHSLAAVLARAPRDLDGFPVTDIADRFLAGGHDLIIEAGGPGALPAPGPAAPGRRQGWAGRPGPLPAPGPQRGLPRLPGASG